MSLPLLFTDLSADESEKNLVGRYAAQLVKNHTTVALGSGSTVKYFIHALAERIKNENLQIKTLASSISSQLLAQSLGIMVLDPGSIMQIDLMVDGADQINKQKELIKGGGGALLREKLLAHNTKNLVIIAEHKKLAAKFTFCLPVEIEPFCHKYTIKKILDLGVIANLRLKNKKPFKTDNNNYIVDIDYLDVELSIQELHKKLKSITGVIETGYFGNLKKRVFLVSNTNIMELE